jgi:GR25 family glycosyltransferase involved in LPS biosynthesis
MTKLDKLRFLFYKARNFAYFEITPFHRINLFQNHIRNYFVKRRKKTAFVKLEIKDTYIISLKFRLDRKDNISSLCSSVKLSFKFFEGSFINNRQILKPYFTDRSVRCLSHGALGCALSHIRLWQKIAKSEEGLYLIFEDDVFFSMSFMNSLGMLANSYPYDCDLFFLGSRNNRPRDILYITETMFARCFNPRMGAFAYALTPNGARKILSLLIPIDLLCGGIDTALGILVRNKALKSYQFYPTQVFHDNSCASNIFNPSVPNKNLHESAISDWPIF